MSYSYEPRAGQGNDEDDNAATTRTAGEKALAVARRERDQLRAENEELVRRFVAEQMRHDATKAEVERLRALIRRLPCDCDPDGECAMCAAREKAKRVEGKRVFADKPRRMVDESGFEHDECAGCKTIGCQPVEDKPAESTLRASCARDKAGRCPIETCGSECKQYAPDPGEGWELCEPWQSEEYWCNDRWFTTCKGISFAESVKFHRRRVEPEKAWDDVALIMIPGGVLIIKSGDCEYSHTIAPSLRGFMGYVYADGSISLPPCRWAGLSVEFPVAVRFAKEK